MTLITQPQVGRGGTWTGNRNGDRTYFPLDVNPNERCSDRRVRRWVAMDGRVTISRFGGRTYYVTALSLGGLFSGRNAALGEGK